MQYISDIDRIIINALRKIFLQVTLPLTILLMKHPNPKPC